MKKAGVSDPAFFNFFSGQSFGGKIRPTVR